MKRLITATLLFVFICPIPLLSLHSKGKYKGNFLVNNRSVAGIFLPHTTINKGHDLLNSSDKRYKNHYLFLTQIKTMEPVKLVPWFYFLLGTCCYTPYRSIRSLVLFL